MKQVRLPAGVYIIGDPSYSLKFKNENGLGENDEWDRILTQTNMFEEPYKKDGLKAVAFRTANGDGGFLDQDGHVYGVDSGMIAIVPLKLAAIKRSKKFFTRRVTFERAFTCTNSNGHMKFGNVRINAAA